MGQTRGGSARSALVLVDRERRRLARDRWFLGLGLLAPLVLATLLAHVMPPWSDAYRSAYVVAYDDRDTPAMEVLRGPIRDLFRTDVADISRVDDSAMLREAVESGWAHAGLHIPAGFSQDIRSGRTAQLTIVGDAQDAFETLVLRRAIEGFVRGLDATRLAAAIVASSTGTSPDPGMLAERSAELGPAMTLVEGQVRDRTPSPRTFYSVGVALLFAFVAAAFGAALLPRERRLGTLVRLWTAGVRPLGVVAAALILAIALAALSLLLAWAVGALVLGERWGDPAGVALLLGAVALTAGGVALMVASVARDETQVVAAASSIAIVLGILGGAFLPVPLAPEPLASLWPLSPVGWAIRGFVELVPSGEAAAALPFAAATSAFGVAAVAAGLLLAHRRGSGPQAAAAGRREGRPA